MPKQQPESDLDRMIRVSTEIRELIKEANQATRDLKQEKKEMRELRERWLNDDDLIAKLDEVAKGAFDTFDAELKRAIDLATEAVYDRFDTIMLICMGEDPLSVREGKRSVMDLIRDFVSAKNLPLHLTEEVHFEMHPDDIANGPRDTKGLISTAAVIPDKRIKVGYPLLVFPPLTAEAGPTIRIVDIHDPSDCLSAATLFDEYAEKRNALRPAAFQRSSGVEPAHRPDPTQ